VDLPRDQERFTALNAELAKGWPTISEKKDAPSDADEWKDVKDKEKYIER
jgi:ferredoxin